MYSIIPDSQQLLAHEFFINDMEVNKRSHQAILAIKRLNWIRKIPTTGPATKNQTEKLVKDSCMSIVPNGLLFSESHCLN